MDSTEMRVVLGMRTATKATVTAWNHQPSPFWTPWLAELDRAIAAAPHAEGGQRLDLRRREALREASKSRWHTLRPELEGTDGNRQQVVRPCLRPSFLEHASHEFRWPNAQQTPEGQPPHEAAGGESNTAPKVPPSATDPDECDGPHPINMAEPGRTLRLLLLGPAPGPDGIHGEALRHLGRVARRAAPWLFDIRLRAGAVPRNRRRGALLLLPNPERTASNRDPHRPVTMSSCPSKLMERISATRIRDVIESQLTLQPSGFLPGNSTPDQLLQIRAAMHRNASQHRTAAVFVDHANAFGTVGPDAVILEMRRLSVPNRIVRWSAACLNNTSAVVCIEKLTPSSRTLTRGAPQGTALSPIMFVVVMQSRCSCLSNVSYFAEDSLLMTALSSHSRATGMRSTRPQKKA
ncbi:hypothetical protein TcYC6_0105440 [Trypanosoma cruzi]|nr:hypothetical protein TcYC6_0105500 [Trypanosoma cruzi]KAF8293845.1 hypothetical protein TcYC6_0105560 [Trypanosoma cruzi]KAF8293925.1 hypothetical protein TcYC6_0105380 [Trypanosoma cruzi]KAF8294085.1 hypothetical protein TcYC6_0105440 [Trypanosoma cruzi]